jgi:hypothetical protein
MEEYACVNRHTPETSSISYIQASLYTETIEGERYDQQDSRMVCHTEFSSSLVG